MKFMLNQKDDLTQGPVGSRLIGLGIPMVFGIFALMAFNLVDTYFVGRLGTNELAAISFTFPVVLLVGAIAMGLGIALTSVVSRMLGKGDSESAQRLTTDGLILAFLIVAVFVIAGFMSMRPIFIFLGATEELLPLITGYMRIWYIGMVFLVVPMVGNSAIRASGDTLSPGCIMMISAFINAILDPLLIFGLAGFPRLELRGAAIATVIARATAFVFSLSILHFRKRMLSLSLPRMQSFIDSSRKILYIGVPSAFTSIFVPLSMGVLTKIVAQFGVSAVAAVGAGIRIEAFALMVIMAASSALIPFIGQNWGAGNFKRICLAQRYVVVFSLCWGLFCVVMFLLTAPILGRLFSDDPEVIGVLVRFLWIVPFGYGLRGVRALTASAFNALNRPLTAAALNSIWMFALYIPFAYFGSRLVGLNGVFFGITLAHLLSGAIAYFWARHTSRYLGKCQGLALHHPDTVV
jgi:putative MATE family efflux protein